MIVGPRFLSHFSGFIVAFSLLGSGFLHAQQQLPAGQPIAPAPADPTIVNALQQVSPENIKAIISKLVTFNNRSTLSSMDTDLAAGTGDAKPIRVANGAAKFGIDLNDRRGKTMRQ